MEDVLGSIQRERAELFAMARAATTELAYEMKKVSRLPPGKPFKPENLKV